MNKLDGNYKNVDELKKKLEESEVLNSNKQKIYYINRIKRI